MRIGFDAKKIVRNMTGIGNYSRGAINALSCHYPENQYYLFTPYPENEQTAKRLYPSPSISFLEPHFHPQSSFLKEWWRCRGIIQDLKRNQIDLFHGLSNELPWGISKAGCKSVVTIHDLIFLRYPHTYDYLSRKLLRAKTQYACQHANKIIAISHQTKEDIINFYHIPESKIEVVYQGCDSIFYRAVSSEEIQAIRKRYGLPDPYLLSVGTLERRKNQKSIIQALSLMKENAHLVLVGKQTPFKQELEQRANELNMRNRIHILGNVRNEDLPAIYQGCSTFIYLSYFEGFGIPILEALVSGVPVIAATGSSLQEVGGPSTLYCDPFDYQRLATLTEGLLSNPEQATEQVIAGKEYARKFSEESMAKHLMEVYQQTFYN